MGTRTTSVATMLLVAGLGGVRAHAQGLTVQQPVISRFGLGTTVSAPGFGGVAIDASGVVSSPKAVRVNAKLERARLRSSAESNLPPDMFRSSKLRKVSLVQLEAELRKLAESRQPIPADVFHLAGLTQIEYIFADRQSNDIILAGPAEGFAATKAGAVIGVESGRPTLVLDDLLVMLRLPTLHQTLGVSFDPEKSRLAKAQTWFQSSPDASTVGQAKKQFRRMADLLGNWNVKLFGLPPSSHVTMRMVDADFQMKRVNLGLRRTGIRGFKSQLEMMKPEDNSMRRYWFAPRYNQIERSANADVFRISGPRLQLLSQEELADAQGNRSAAAFTEVSTEAYTRQFNKHIDELCQRIPAFAALQNVFDMAIVAALIRKHDLFRQVGWKPAILTDDKVLLTAVCPVPKEVPSQLNLRVENKTAVMFQIGGGVTLVPTAVIEKTSRLSKRVDLSPPADAWWWD